MLKLRQWLARQELDALFVTQQENRRYLSGFTGSTGCLLITASSASLAVDFRYLEQAKREAPEFEIVHTKGGVVTWLPQLVSDLRVTKLGFEADHISFAVYTQLCEELTRKQYQFQLVPAFGAVESLRSVKEPEELRSIVRAVELAASALEYTERIIRPGITEKEAAWELERFLREKGSEPLPFDIIVVSGPNSSLPHARPSDKVICSGEPVVIDLGACVNGYCSDLSRTLFLGEEDETFSRIYDAVFGAQLTALTVCEAGMTGDEVDRLARMVIEQAGYGDAFGHSLGHGIGLAAHESPRITPGSSDLLVDSMVFTIEPGIYISGWGGVRIEDTAVMENGKIKTLSRTEKIASNFRR